MRRVRAWLVLAAWLALGTLGEVSAQDAKGKAEVDALARRAMALEDAEKLEEATRVAEKMVARAKQVFGATDLHTAGLMYDLGRLYHTRGRYAKAESLYRQSLKIRQARQGKDHPDVAHSLNALAALYKDFGQYAKAEPMFQRSLKILEDKLGKDDYYVSLVLHNLAFLYQVMGQYAKAEPLYKRGLKIKESKLGKDHPVVADTLHNLAYLYQDMRKYAEAVPLYQRSLRITEARRGKDDPLVAATLANLGVIHLATGEYARAEPLFQRSLKIWEAKRGKDAPELINALDNLALLDGLTGKYAEAARLFDRARRGARRYLVTVLPGLSEPEKVAFFQKSTVQPNLARALSLGLARQGDALSASWLLNSKAVDQESLTASLLLARVSDNPAVAKLTGQLRAVRQRLAGVSFSKAQPGQEMQRQRQIEELTIQELELSKKLRQAGSRAAPPIWVELAEVRKTLPADAVLIDISRFQVFDFKAGAEKGWQAAHYVAWVTPPKGAVRVVDLGPALKIDEAVKQFREAMKQAGKQVKDSGEEKAEKALRERLDALSRLVLQPLLPCIGTGKKWLISPDGNLWLLPWEALTLKDGKYVIEHYQLSYLTSGRDLLPLPATKVKPTAPLVLADPDFDLDPSKANAERKRLLAQGEDEHAPRGQSRALHLGSVPRLPGTAAEAKAIWPSLAAYAGVKPRLYLRGRALEGVLKAARHPRVLVLCTHGFFLPDQEIARDDRSRPGKPKVARKWENPLLRCGLLLAGCNNASKATNGDDGVLTGLEVLEADLRGCDLVVLSACDTGIGAVQSGEGVSGLRQAFQLAGAQAVVSTLWQVPDKASARLMSLFFKNLSAGQSKAEALRSAKLKLIEERREDFAAAHPFFWAAFTLTGQ
jgi:CHAT domain-containing protein/Tfp pilus assembly protein PilF